MKFRYHWHRPAWNLRRTCIFSLTLTLIDTSMLSDCITLFYSVGNHYRWHLRCSIDHFLRPSFDCHERRALREYDNVPVWNWLGGHFPYFPFTLFTGWHIHSHIVASNIDTYVLYIIGVKTITSMTLNCTSVYNVDILILTSCVGGRHNMPPPLQVDLWPFDLESGVRVTCDVAYLCVNFSLPRPLYSRLRPDVRDRQTSDAHHRLMLPPYGGGA